MRSTKACKNVGGVKKRDRLKSNWGRVFLKNRLQLVIDIFDVSYYDIGMEDFLAMIKACIFDLDGTIGNTLDSMVYSVNLTLKEMNLSEISKEQCREFVGNGARVLMEKALDASGNPGATRIEEGMQIYGRIFDENCTYHVTPCEGVRKCCIS